MNKSIQEETIREDANKKGVESCDRGKREIYTEERGRSTHC